MGGGGWKRAQQRSHRRHSDACLSATFLQNGILPDIEAVAALFQPGDMRLAASQHGGKLHLGNFQGLSKLGEWIRGSHASGIFSKEYSVKNFSALLFRDPLSSLLYLIQP